MKKQRFLISLLCSLLLISVTSFKTVNAEETFNDNLVYKHYTLQYPKASSSSNVGEIFEHSPLWIIKEAIRSYDASLLNFYGYGLASIGSNLYYFYIPQSILQTTISANGTKLTIPNDKVSFLYKITCAANGTVQGTCSVAQQSTSVKNSLSFTFDINDSTTRIGSENVLYVYKDQFTSHNLRHTWEDVDNEEYTMTKYVNTTSNYGGISVLKTDGTYNNLIHGLGNYNLSMPMLHFNSNFELLNVYYSKPYNIRGGSAVVTDTYIDDAAVIPFVMVKNLNQMRGEAITTTCQDFNITIKSVKTVEDQKSQNQGLQPITNITNGVGSNIAYNGDIINNKTVTLDGKTYLAGNLKASAKSLGVGEILASPNVIDSASYTSLSSGYVGLDNSTVETVQEKISSYNYADSKTAGYTKIVSGRKYSITPTGNYACSAYSSTPTLSSVSAAQQPSNIHTRDNYYEYNTPHACSSWNHSDSETEWDNKIVVDNCSNIPSSTIDIDYRCSTKTVGGDIISYLEERTCNSYNYTRSKYVCSSKNYQFKSELVGEEQITTYYTCDLGAEKINTSAISSLLNAGYNNFADNDHYTYYSGDFQGLVSYKQSKEGAVYGNPFTVFAFKYGYSNFSTISVYKDKNLYKSISINPDSPNGMFLLNEPGTYEIVADNSSSKITEVISIPDITLSVLLDNTEIGTISKDNFSNSLSTFSLDLTENSTAFYGSPSELKIVAKDPESIAYFSNLKSTIKIDEINGMTKQNIRTNYRPFRYATTPVLFDDFSIPAKSDYSDTQTFSSINPSSKFPTMNTNLTTTGPFIKDEDYRNILSYSIGKLDASGVYEFTFKFIPNEFVNYNISIKFAVDNTEPLVQYRDDSNNLVTKGNSLNKAATTVRKTITQFSSNNAYSSNPYKS